MILSKFEKDHSPAVWRTDYIPKGRSRDRLKGNDDNPCKHSGGLDLEREQSTLDISEATGDADFS